MIDIKHWQDALDIQSACNLSGVVRSFAEAMTAISEEAHRIGQGTDWRNTHPICVLFSTQIGHLTKTSAIAEESTYSAAYRQATRLVEINKEIGEIYAQGNCERCGDPACWCDGDWSDAAKILRLEQERDSIMEKINGRC